MAPIAAPVELNSREWPVLCDPDWELVEEEAAMAFDEFPEEKLSWAARVTCGQTKAAAPKMTTAATPERAAHPAEAPQDGHESGDGADVDPKELARETRSRHVAKGGQTLRGNAKVQWVTVVAQEESDTSHLQMLRQMPIREPKVQQKPFKKEKNSKDRDKDMIQNKKQTNRMDIREGLKLMGFA
ncbi:unnamed protein product [Effrenium voratum]|nr:unnamed protein product [Effrenium voratum]